MNYVLAPVMIVVHPLHAQVLVALVPENVLVRELRHAPPEAARAVLDSHRSMAAHVRWIEGGHQPPAQDPVDAPTAEASHIALQAVPALSEPAPE